MTDQAQRAELRPTTAVEKDGETKRPPEGNKLPPGAVNNGPTAEPGYPHPPDLLTPEEQMALFEKELKEKDWGHQPC